jgi:cellulose synthase/poly-beta-1,6-N-acetylglucosamine synthase-like glycosyltransferase
MFEIIIICVVCVSFSLIMLHFFLFRLRFILYKQKTDLSSPKNLPSVSVVICAKNEEHNLKTNLPLILEQDYPQFELIVVDDNSTDETYYVLKEFQQQHNNLNVIKLTENVNFFSGKKFPLSIGIRSAKYNYLLLTDADCMPLSSQWIQTMASQFSDEKQIVLGYGKYEENKGFLDKLIRFETMYNAGLYFSFALGGLPYMGVGRNLAYTKQLFTESKGFSKHYNVVSGDDDLFINSVATKKNTSTCLSANSFTVSKAKSTFGAWVKQKRRHLTAGAYYKGKHKLLLALYPVSLLIFYTSFGIAMFQNNNFYILSALFTVKVILSMLYFRYLSQKLKENKILFFSMFFELFFVFFNGLIMFFNVFSKQGKWK